MLGVFYDKRKKSKKMARIKKAKAFKALAFKKSCLLNWLVELQ
jgi:hypothetical protein